MLMRQLREQGLVATEPTKRQEEGTPSTEGEELETPFVQPPVANELTPRGGT